MNWKFWKPKDVIAATPEEAVQELEAPVQMSVGEFLMKSFKLAPHITERIAGLNPGDTFTVTPYNIKVSAMAAKAAFAQYVLEDKD